LSQLREMGMPNFWVGGQLATLKVEGWGTLWSKIR